MLYHEAQDAILRFALDIAPEFADRFERWPDENLAHALVGKLEPKIKMYRDFGMLEAAVLLSRVSLEMLKRVKAGSGGVADSVAISW